MMNAEHARSLSAIAKTVRDANRAIAFADAMTAREKYIDHQLAEAINKGKFATSICVEPIWLEANAVLSKTENCIKADEGCSLFMKLMTQHGYTCSRLSARCVMVSWE